MIKKNTFTALLGNGSFKELFTEMGWNNYRGNATLPPIRVDNREFNFRTIAERSGFQVLECTVESIPTTSLHRRIDVKLKRQANDYIAIYRQKDTQHHLWAVPIRRVEKRDIVTIEYENVKQADFLFTKMAGLSFEFTELPTIVDVKQRVQTAFTINSEKITKDFYAGFKKEHDSFVKFVSGIDDHIKDHKANRSKQWYASVMLNRLMFCYFIQKKGFLDGDPDYLRNKLELCRRQRGKGKFFKSFYKTFLLSLFHDGLNAPQHNRDFEQVYGKIPYLNGGLFDHHQIERNYADIDIQDEAFEHLFNFFDKWRWHLDTRLTATGKDINPDVLGYIFEQYINDRSKMGAYYTKEDITEYIGRNCILPFLFDKVGKSSTEMEKLFSPTGMVWKYLQASGDRYVFDAVKHGYSPDWRTRIPAHIAKGLDTTAPGLLERRADWNSRTPEDFGLPTEIWRESIERLQRCESILGKISAGDITQINDFITYNLDIRALAQNLLEQTDNHRFIGKFYHALQEVTILDPTCGSGAFLFAALNILEPLYEICISRMQDFNASNPLLFKDELAEIFSKYRSNIQYFIYKSIILRNLYGVDIMAEAVEIAKLRLFLKMVAVVDVNPRKQNLGLDPLPDIDFNIRCGNTLVGYATEEEIIKDADADLFTSVKFQEKIRMEMQKVSMTYDAFRDIQLSQQENVLPFKEAKSQLRSRLDAFTDTLNRQMFSNAGASNYDKWLESHQPFHWIAEFYQIIHGNGGFDVIIGNPPYVGYNEKKFSYTLIHNYDTFRTGNLYTFCIERSLRIVHPYSYLSMIVPISLIGNTRMELCLNKLLDHTLWISSYSGDTHPGTLFSGVQQNLCIFDAKINNIERLYTTNFIRFYDGSYERSFLFNSRVYYSNNKLKPFLKIGSETQKRIFEKLATKTSHEQWSRILQKTSSPLYYHDVIHYWVKSFTEAPFFSRNGETASLSSHYKKIECCKEYKMATAIALTSTIFYIWYISKSNGRDFSADDWKSYKFDFLGFYKSHIYRIALDHYNSYIKNLEKNKKRVTYKKKSGTVVYDQYWVTNSKPIIDCIDTALAEHYGFTEEELDFIINYDIKYRMGEELNDDE